MSTTSIPGLRRKAGQTPRPAGSAKAGFTLIEMLVSVALVLLLMVLFAEVFQISANTVSQQKGLGENDQRARTLTTIIKGDLDRRTFENVTPWGADEPDGADPGKRRGYFYISENEPFDDTDDVLQFTIQVGSGEERLTGKAIQLPDLFNDPPGEQTGQALLQPDADDGEIFYVGGGARSINDPGFANIWAPSTAYALDATVVPLSGPNGFFYRATVAGTSGGAEPAWPTTVGNTVVDGGVTWVNAGPLQSNNTGASRWAEVSYFLRNGNLYRRVLLLRQPYIQSTGTNPIQPHNNNTDNDFLFDTDGDGSQDEYFDFDLDGNPDPDSGFWKDFDYSAHYAVGGFAQFHSQNDLRNDSLSPGLFQLGQPNNRFGHDHVLPSLALNRFHPREFTDPTNHATFIGRFTQEETSHPDFGYPGRQVELDGDADNNDSPMEATILLTLAADGVVDEFRGGSRRGEDVLLSNVHSFDVKVWDELYDEDADTDGVLDAGEDANRSGALETIPPGATVPTGAFADVGHAASVGGDFRQVNDLHANNVPALRYGPRAMQINNRVFDTWHPRFDLDNDATNDPPPYRPEDDPDGTPGSGDEVPKRLQAIQIRIRYLDVASGQMRQVTLVHSLVQELDNN